MKRIFSRLRRSGNQGGSEAASSPTAPPATDFYLSLLARPAITDALGVEELSAFRRKLLSTGAFRGSPLVFLAAQVGAVLAGLVIMLLLPGWIPFLDPRVAAGVAIIVMVIPYSQVSTEYLKAQKRELEELSHVINVFALVAFASRNSLPSALQRVARQVDSSISDHIQYALNHATGGTPLQDALRERIPHLAAEVSRVFFADVAESHERGTPLRQIVKSTQEMVQHELFEARRAVTKKMSTKLMFVNAIHFLGTAFGFIGVIQVYQLMKGLMLQ